ncbi:hypothetical protein OSTOST_04519 [Ostertagia ostertagi]
MDLSMSNAFRMLLQMRLLNSMGMQEPPNVDSIDLSPSTIEEMLEALGENDKIEHDQEEKTFIMAVDPSDGIDPDMLVARFPVSLTTMVRKVSRAYLHVYLHVSNGPLPEPEIVTVVVRERLLNGDIGDVVATNPVEIQRSGKAVLPLKSSDVERCPPKRFAEDKSQIWCRKSGSAVPPPPPPSIRSDLI